MNLERVGAIYAAIETYEIQLARDPRSLGPLYLQNSIAECRNFLNLVSRMQLEVHREKQELSRRLRALEASFEVSFTELLATDTRIRGLPSIEDRKATANSMLRAEQAQLTALRAELQDLDFVDKAVLHRHKELSSTMSEIKLQRSLIRDEIDSGAQYGDERKFDHETNPGKGPLGDDELSDEAIAAMMADPDVCGPVMEAAHIEPGPDVIADPVKSVTDLDASKVADFLGDPATYQDGVDLGTIFENL